jgi:PEP-CTERM motif-containing protein
MLAYASPSTAHDWMFGFEDTKFGDKDYQDMVFRVSDLVTAIPEPETYAMLLAGLGLMVFVARRRRQNAIA